VGHVGFSKIKSKDKNENINLLGDQSFSKIHGKSTF